MRTLAASLSLPGLEVYRIDKFKIRSGVEECEAEVEDDGPPD